MVVTLLDSFLRTYMAEKDPPSLCVTEQDHQINSPLHISILLVFPDVIIVVIEHLLMLVKIMLILY